MTFTTIQKYVEKKFAKEDDITKIIYTLYELRNKHKKAFDEKKNAYANGELDNAGFASMIRSAELAAYSHYIKNITQELLRDNYEKTHIAAKNPSDILLLAKIKSHLEGNIYEPIKNY